MAEPSVGDLLECAIWLDGTETEQQVKDWKERDCISALTQMAAGSMVIIGPVDYEIKYPGEDRVPPVPDHVSGPDVAAGCHRQGGRRQTHSGPRAVVHR